MFLIWDKQEVAPATALNTSIFYEQTVETEAYYILFDPELIENLRLKRTYSLLALEILQQVHSNSIITTNSKLLRFKLQCFNISHYVIFFIVSCN